MGIPAPPRALPAASTLRRGADIRAVFAARRSAGGEGVVAHVRPRDDRRPARWAVIAGRKVGNAVHRNRAKRRLRAAAAAVELPAGFDVVLSARPAALHLPFGALTAEIGRVVAQAARRAP